MGEGELTMCTKEASGIICEKTDCRKYDEKLKYNCGCSTRIIERYYNEEDD